MDPDAGRQRTIPGLPNLPQAAKFGAREMASQIVMDRTGDTRHIFDNRDRVEVAKAEQRFRELTGAGFTAAVRTGLGEQRIIRSFDPTAEETLFYPHLWAADRSEPTNPACGRLVRPRLDLYAAAFGAFAVWFLRNRGAGADPAEGMALAKAARLLRALPVFRRRRQRYRHALPDTPRHPDQHRGTEPHGATCLQMVLLSGWQPRRWRCDACAEDRLETNERGALSVAHRSFVSMGPRR
jgi:hypothetical protein